jgi:hypothetical protein
MIGFQSLPLGKPNGGAQPSTMLLPWLVLVSLASPMPWLNLDGIYALFSIMIGPFLKMILN